MFSRRKEPRRDLLRAQIIDAAKAKRGQFRAKSCRFEIALEDLPDSGRAGGDRPMRRQRVGTVA